MMMSQFCFLCNNTDISVKTEDIHDKYKEVVGTDLFPDYQLCNICCHLLNKLWRFRSLCLKQSLEYPVLFSKQALVNLQKNELQYTTVCSENECYTYPSNDDNSYKYNTLYLNHNYSEQYTDDIIHSNVISCDNDMSNDFGSDVSQHSNTNFEFDTEKNLNDTLIEEPNDVLQENIDESIELNNEIDENDIGNIDVAVKKKKKVKKTFKKTVLSVEEQKTCLENLRKGKKYIESEFKCYNCAIGFLFKDTYQAHMMRHEESNGEFQCPICTLRFASSSVLRAHKSTHSHRYTCTVCNQPVRGKVRKTHADRCHRGVTVNANCHLCGGVFKDSTALQQHVRRSHRWKSQRRRLACGVCGAQCLNHAALRTHIMKHLKRSFPCDSCASTFSSPYTLTQHKKAKHTTTDEIELHYCELCNVSFSNKKGLSAHKRNTVKHQQTYVECEICYRVLTTRRALLRHIQSVHCLNKPRSKNVAQPTICHVCGHSFKGKSKLNRHLKKVCEKSQVEEQPIYQPDYSCYYENSDFMNL